MYLIHAQDNSPHYAVLRCRQHGFVKWLSQTQYQELSEIMYGKPARPATEYLF
jgi:hypothetical protein